MTLLKRFRPFFLVAIAAALLAFEGCASCGTCQGAEPDDGDVPPPPAAGPHAVPGKARPWPSAPARDAFTTPPTDARDEAPEPEPKLDLAQVLKDKGLVVNQTGNGSISINSPGQAAPPAVAAFPYRDAFTTPPVAVPTAPTTTLVTAPTTVATPIIPGPLTDQQYVGIFKRLAGAGYYAATGKCPTFAGLAARRAARKATVPVAGAAVVPVAGAAVVPTQSYAVVPTTSYAQVPVTSMATVPVTSYAAVPLPSAAPQVLAVPAAPAQAVVPQAAPASAPVLPTPQASPQTLAAPRKASFSLFR
jgi:hypothetical protein